VLQPLQELAAGEHGRRQVRLHMHQQRAHRLAPPHMHSRSRPTLPLRPSSAQMRGCHLLLASLLGVCGGQVLAVDQEVLDCGDRVNN